MDKQVVKEYVPRVGAIGIAVYCYLASLTNPQQSCFPSQKHIAGTLGCSRATVNRAIKKLAEHGLIAVEKSGRYHQIYHLLDLRGHTAGTQLSPLCNSAVTQVNTNNSNKQEISTNNGLATMKPPKDGSDSTKGSGYQSFEPRTREQLLAVDLAKALHDEGNLPLYLSYTGRYSESSLRRALGTARETPAEEIRKSRAALFCFLVKHYENESSTHNPRH